MKGEEKVRRKLNVRIGEWVSPGLCLTLASDPILEETFFKSGGFASPTGALLGGISAGRGGISDEFDRRQESDEDISFHDKLRIW